MTKLHLSTLWPATVGFDRFFHEVESLLNQTETTSTFPPHNIIKVSDSKYVVESVEKKWLDNWIKTDFKGGKKNKDLWLDLYNLNKSLNVKWVWVKAHAGNPLNEEVDLLAKKAANLE